MLADSYSDFIEVGELKGTTAIYIIEFLKELFSRHGIPDVLVTDNGPQNCCREFTEFSEEWEFKHVTSSPSHVKSNGKAESAVKVAKFKKAHRDNKDPWLALLDQRNTPTQGVNSSPVQRLKSRRTRTLLPVSANLLYPRVEEGVKEKLKAKRQTAKGYYDRSTKALPELEIGQEVRVAGQRNKIWEPGTCVQKIPCWSQWKHTTPKQRGTEAQERHPNDWWDYCCRNKTIHTCTCTVRWTNSIEEYQSQCCDHTS